MSQIIVTSRFLKAGTAKTKSQRKNYIKYIATRETVELREQKKFFTENQEKLLQELLSDFPDAKKYLEYEDYKNNSTAENASELISAIIERNANVIGNRQNFVGYMAINANNLRIYVIYPGKKIRKHKRKLCKKIKYKFVQKAN